MTKLIPLTQGKFAIIDDKDFELVSQHKWYARKGSKTFYAVTKIPINGSGGNYATIYMHRFILCLERRDSMIDHIDCDGLNNSRQNIRLCTAAENIRNRRIASNNTSGLKGASWDKHANKWIAHIKINGKAKHLGCFDSKEDAHTAYCKAALELHGEFCRFR